MSRRSLSIFTGVALLCATAPLSAQRLFAGDPGARFTTEQVTRGQAAYGRVCVSCHGAALEGSQFAPTLKGAAFESHWQGRTRAEFSEHLRTTMPPRGLGSVSGQAYTDIEAWLMQMNGHRPAGTQVAKAVMAKTAAPAAAPESRVVGASPRQVQRRGDEGPVYQQVVAARTAKLAALTPVTDAMLREPPAAD